MRARIDVDATPGRRVVMYELMSLDGFADDPGEGEWFRDAGPGLGDFLADTIASQDAVLLGRTTYEKWSPYWPTATMQPFADFINGTPKFVFSRRPITGEWANSTRVTESPESFVTDLKARPGRDIGVHGSLSLGRSLLAAGLVDELRLVLAPSLAGSGKRLFADDGTVQRFDLVNEDRSGGCLLLHYRRRTDG